MYSSFLRPGGASAHSRPWSPAAILHADADRIPPFDVTRDDQRGRSAARSLRSLRLLDGFDRDVDPDLVADRAHVQERTVPPAL